MHIPSQSPQQSSYQLSSSVNPKVWVNVYLVMKMIRLTSHLINGFTHGFNYSLPLHQVYLKTINQHQITQTLYTVIIYNMVNSNIPREIRLFGMILQIMWSIQFNSFGGNNKWQRHIENASRIIPIHQSDNYLLRVTCEGQNYYEKCLPEKASSSCQIFE